MNILIGFLLVLFISVALLLILAVLMQRTKQDGLGAAFGGGLTETVFGAQTSAILVKFTAWLIGLFFFLAILLAWLYGYRGHHQSELSRRLHEVPAAAAVAVPVPAPVTAPGIAPAAATPAPAAPAVPAPIPVPAKP